MKLIEAKHFWSELDYVAPLMTGPLLSYSTTIQNQTIAACQSCYTDMEKTNFMNSVEFNFLKDFLPNLVIFLPNLDP